MAVFVYVNHGRWMVKCPWCKVAAIAKSDSFFCEYCKNGIEEKPVNAIWPLDKKKEEIRRLLRVRPLEAQNWEPGEMTANLLAENVKHGVNT